MTLVELLDAYAAHLEAGALAYENGDEPTTAWRRGRRDFDARLRSAGHRIGGIPTLPGGDEAIARWQAAGVRFQTVVRSRISDVEAALGSSGRVRRGHRAYIGGSEPRGAFYLQRRS